MESPRKAVHPKAHAAPRENAMFRAFASLYSKGTYHVFYEYFPFGLYSSRRYIAHSASEDLLLWKAAPIAIYPTKKADEDGAYEGSALADPQTGDIELFYVGINYLKRDPNDLNTCLPDSRLKTNLMAVTSTPGSLGFAFDNVANKRLLVSDEQLKGLGLASGSLRDPEAYRESDASRWLTVLAEDLKGHSVLCFFKGTQSAKTGQWDYEYQGKKTFEKKMALRTIRFFTCQGQSLVAMESDYPTFEEPKASKFKVWLGKAHLDFAKQDVSFDFSSFVPFDYGFDCHSPKVAYDTRNLPYLMGSLLMNHDIKGERGMLTCPRRVSLDKNGQIVTEIHPLIAKRFLYKSGEIKIRQTHFPLLIQATFQEGSYLKLGKLAIYLTNQALHVDRRKIMDKPSHHVRLGLASLRLAHVPAKVAVLLDQDVVEVQVEGKMISFITLDSDSSIAREELADFSISCISQTKS